MNWVTWFHTNTNMNFSHFYGQYFCGFKNRSGRISWWKKGIFHQLLKPEKLIFYGSWQKKKGFRNARKLSFWKCLCCCFHRKLPHSAVKTEKCAIWGRGKKKFKNMLTLAFEVIMQPHTICFCTIFPFLKHCMLERYLAEDWIFK